MRGSKIAAVCIVSSVLGLILLFTLLRAVSDAQARKITTDIYAFVEENETEIFAALDAQQPKVLEDGGFVIEVWEKEEYVEFYCRGRGIGPAGAYYGFYFSPDDKPLGAGYVADDCLQLQGTAYVYRQSNGDNAYITTKIVDHLWYYEAHF